MSEKPCPSCMPAKKGPWWKNKVVIMVLVYLVVLVLGGPLSFFAPLMKSLTMYIRTVALPLFVGLLLGGIIDWLVPREYVSKLLAHEKRTIVYSVMAGFLMSVCSHGILALAIQLYKKGASIPAVIAFLLASPWANLPLTILMFGFFGARAFLIVVSAVIVALVSGYIFMFLERRSLIESNPNTIEVSREFSIVEDAKQRLVNVKMNISTVFRSIRAICDGSISLANMVLWWIMLGMLLASIVAAYLPPGFMYHYMGPTFVGLVVTLFLATIIEICSEGSAPLAFEIYRQTGALGNSFVFLMAGVVTDYTEIGLLWTNIGWKTAVWLPVITVPQVIVIGLIFNALF